MACLLCVFDNQPDMQPMSVGKVLGRIFINYNFVLYNGNVKAVCGSTNLCACLKADIRGILYVLDKRASESGSLGFKEDSEDNIPCNVAE